ncbi:MAG: hypothetical protein QW379_06130 [Thermoplasmata archaeon]
MSYGRGTNTDGQQESRSWLAPNTHKVKDLYGTTGALLWLALIINILVVLGAIIIIVGFTKFIALIFRILAFVFSALSPFVYLGMHPRAFRDDWSVDGGAPSSTTPTYIPRSLELTRTRKENQM